MTPACMVYVERVLREHPEIKGNTLEVGSYNVNGSVRSLFDDRGRFPFYNGIDICAGPGVDIVASSRTIPHVIGSVLVIVSTEMLEHDERFWDTLRTFHVELEPGGHVILTTRGIGFKRHNYPSDYWRFTADGLRSILEHVGFTVLECVEDEVDQGVFALGRKSS